MKIQVCSRCNRINPPAALYCHHDGLALGNGAATGPMDAGAAFFLAPFVFPSGRTCRNFDELVLAAEQLWDEAQEQLRGGQLAAFFGGIGRGDLARAAGQAKDAPDSERALDAFLQRLPSSVRQPAKLHVQPVEFSLGVVRRQELRRLTLVIRNQGMAILHGTVAAVDAPWLVVGDPPGVPARMFECRQEIVLPVHVVGDRMWTSDKPLEGKLVLETNGGNAIVPVRAEMPSKLFSGGVLTGSASPRQLAEKARASPKDAVAFFESGAIRAWYAVNGWPWPIKGPSARGLGAVQQFFEALGLTAPPRVHVSELFVKFVGKPGETHQHTLRATTNENKPVYAFAKSELPWLQIGRISGSGKTVRIELQAKVPDRPGESLLGRIEVLANGGQRLTVAVALAIEGRLPPQDSPAIRLR